jgi:predicted CXXCH cytochrome family protein
LLRNDRHGRTLFTFAVLAAAACASLGPVSAPPRAGLSTILSNVDRADYAGSTACQPCHSGVVAAWERSPMHRMTRDAPAAESRAPFDGTRWRFKNDTASLDHLGADRFVRIDAADAETHTYRVTRIIGGRTREDFAGVDVARLGDEVVLPISYVFSTRSLRYKGYSVMVHERDGLRAGPVWRQACIFCHNTVPEVDRLLGAIAGSRAPRYQGEQVDPWLPAGRRAHVEVTDSGAFGRSVDQESARLGGSTYGSGTDPQAKARAAIAVVRAGFDAGSLVEVGIGCEACHGGAAAHVRDPRLRPSFIPVASWLRVSLPDSGRAAAINRVCARCHQVLFSRYPFTWEGGRRDGVAGGSHINSGEARDFLLGGCAAAMACTDCHDPHGGARSTGTVSLTLTELATPRGNGVCTRCHAALADAEPLRRHAHHEPDGAGGSCVACHMPRKNMGLSGALTRYHRIGSPTDPDRVLGDRPLECALCHADKRVDDLVQTMESWWPVRYPRQRLSELYGSLDANVLAATVERGKPHEQATAMAALGEARVQTAAPLIARQLLNDYPLVREWAKHALESILGRCDIDLSSDDATIAAQAQSCAGTTPAASPLLAPVPPAREEPED